MYDIHNHIIPAIDDGAEHIEMSIEMLTMAVEQGISHMVLTPHLHLGRYSQKKTEIYDAFNLFHSQLIERAVSMPQLTVAAEVRFNEFTQEAIENDEVPFLGEWEGERVILLEWPPGTIPPSCIAFCRWLREQCIRPLIAHPERNRDVQDSFKKRMKPFVDIGCLFQVTSASVIGRLGDRVQNVSRALLDEGWIQVMASDAHHPIRRPPDLQFGYEVLAQWLGSKKAKELVYDCPRVITQHLFASTTEQRSQESPQGSDEVRSSTCFEVASPSDNGRVFETMAVVDAVNRLDDLMRSELSIIRNRWWWSMFSSAVIGGVAGSLVFWGFWVWLA